MSTTASSAVLGKTQNDARILVVEDDVALAGLLQAQLASETCNVDMVHDGESACRVLEAERYHLLVLDLNLPKLDGVSLLRQVRPRDPSLPVLVLTARSRVEDRVLSLDTGADDCLTKPFSLLEFSARVRALLRRNKDVPQRKLRVGDLLLYREEMRVERAGIRIALTTKEFTLLEYMMRNASQPLTRAMIIDHVWGVPMASATNNLVDVYVKYVRDKVDGPFSKKLIRTIRGVGYVLSDN